jgi:hypothetical protein
MLLTRRLLCLALLTLAPGTTRSFAATVLYGITLDDNLLQITVTPSSVSASLIGQLDTVASGGSSSLVIGQLNGDLYIYDQNQQALLQISPANASTLATINLGIS